MAVFTVTLGRLRTSPADVSRTPPSRCRPSCRGPSSRTPRRGANQLLTDAAMVRRVYYPRAVRPSPPRGCGLDFASASRLLRVGPFWAPRWHGRGCSLRSSSSCSHRGGRRRAALRGAERLLPGLPVRAAVRRPALALRLARRLPTFGRPRGVARPLRRREPGGGDPGRFFQCARQGDVPDPALLGTAWRGWRSSVRSGTCSSTGSSPTSRM